VTEIQVTKIDAEAWVSSGHRPMGFPEFVVVIASIMALNPLAMDMMLPALSNIRSAFQLADPNHPQLVLSTFLFGFGIGQFAMGPLSDRFGRRPILLGGMVLYALASLLAIGAPSFETLLLARAMQGLGTSATRVIATSIVRDCYAGRRMASVMSLAMMVFIAVPVIAPSFGQVVLLLAQWRGIFVVLIDGEFDCFALVRLNGAWKQAQPEASCIAVAHRLQRHSAENLPAELGVAESRLVSSVGD